MEKHTMYRVEKFLPPECPKCRAVFATESEDYGRFLGDIVDGHKKIRCTTGYIIIMCCHCDNMTACYLLETFQFFSKAKAEAMLDKGFVNLIEVVATGNMAKEHHAVMGQMSGLRVESIKCDDEITKTVNKITRSIDGTKRKRKS